MGDEFTIYDTKFILHNPDELVFFDEDEEDNDE